MAATLVIEDDGDFIATGWPRNLLCETPGGENLSALATASTLSIEGEWEAIATKGSTGLLLYFHADGCRVSIAPSVMTLPDGTVVLDIPLRPQIDPDDLLPDETARFVKTS
ncbi:hypothetical protein AB0N73_12435 [Microbacterium sp. NPDC089189]|uniref:hypothetical protein n=1 Tax=Microbacterium sp. NPDC089189 TaxID=3154972 RepID=UPI00341A674E